MEVVEVSLLILEVTCFDIDRFLPIFAGSSSAD